MRPMRVPSSLALRMTARTRSAEIVPELCLGMSFVAI
jgi:hypothetical protein